MIFYRLYIIFHVYCSLNIVTSLKPFYAISIYVSLISCVSIWLLRHIKKKIKRFIKRHDYFFLLALFNLDKIDNEKHPYQFSTKCTSYYLWYTNVRNSYCILNKDRNRFAWYGTNYFWLWLSYNEYRNFPRIIRTRV